MHQPAALTAQVVTPTSLLQEISKVLQRVTLQLLVRQLCVHAQGSLCACSDLHVTKTTPVFKKRNNINHPKWDILEQQLPLSTSASPGNSSSRVLCPGLLLLMPLEEGGVSVEFSLLFPGLYLLSDCSWCQAVHKQLSRINKKLIHAVRNDQKSHVTSYLCAYPALKFINV